MHILFEGYPLLFKQYSHKTLLLEGSDDGIVRVDEGITYDVFIHGDVYISHIHWCIE